MSKNVKIFIHTNKKIKSHNKKIKFIYHNLSKIHPFKLTWVCRKLMLKQKNLYDMFIYGEDDLSDLQKKISITGSNKKKCLNDNFNLGIFKS